MHHKQHELLSFEKNVRERYQGFADHELFREEGFGKR